MNKLTSLNMPLFRRVTPRESKKEETGSNPYLLFDAGGTLVFPNIDIIYRELIRSGKRVNPKDLYKGYYQLIKTVDQKAGQHVESISNPWPRGYAYALFKTLGILDKRTNWAANEIQKRHINNRNLWTFTYGWVRTALEQLKQEGYRMSVLSNSDGRAEEVFTKLNLAGYFEKIFDSTNYGIEKPNPALFHKVLEELGIDTSQVIYIGDLYEVDVKGANLAGIAAIHIDPLEQYQHLPGVHLTDVTCLPDWLKTHKNNWESSLKPKLFPFSSLLQNTITLIG